MKRKFAAFSLAVLFASGILLSGCGSSEPASSSKSASETIAEIQESQTNAKELEDAFFNALPENIPSLIEDRTCIASSGKYSATIKTYVIGAYYFPEIIESGVKSFFDKAAELNLEVSDFTLLEYLEDENHNTTQMVSWRTSDGISGTFTCRSSFNITDTIKPNYTADDIRSIIGERPERLDIEVLGQSENSDVDEATLKALEPYQGEWYESEHPKWRIYIDDSKMTDVLFNNYDEKDVYSSFDFHIGINENGNIVKKNQYDQIRGIFSIDDNGNLILTDESGNNPETYIKAEKQPQKIDIENYQGEWTLSDGDYERLFIRDSKFVSTIFSSSEDKVIQINWGGYFQDDIIKGPYIVNQNGQKMFEVAFNDDGSITISESGGKFPKTYIKSENQTHDDIIL